MKLSIMLWFTINAFLSKPTECKYRFIIDKKNYFIEEKQLNDVFGYAFQELISTNNAKDKDFELWSQSYSSWRMMACQGTYSWDIYYNKITNGKYTGTANNSDLGLGDDNKLAKGNPNKSQNHAHRMAILNGLMRKHLTYYFLQKHVE